MRVHVFVCVCVCVRVRVRVCETEDEHVCPIAYMHDWRCVVCSSPRSPRYATQPFAS